MMTDSRKPVFLVIGAGAAGMMCAAVAGQRGKRLAVPLLLVAGAQLRIELCLAAAHLLRGRLGGLLGGLRGLLHGFFHCHVGESFVSSLEAGKRAVIPCRDCSGNLVFLRG